MYEIEEGREVSRRPRPDPGHAFEGAEVREGTAPQTLVDDRPGSRRSDSGQEQQVEPGGLVDADTALGDRVENRIDGGVGGPRDGAENRQAHGEKGDDEPRDARGDRGRRGRCLPRIGVA